MWGGVGVVIGSVAGLWRENFRGGGIIREVVGMDGLGGLRGWGGGDHVVRR